MADMYGTPASLLTASAMPSDSDDFSTFSTHLLHNSPSSYILSKPKTSPPPWLPPPLGSAGFGPSGSDSPHKNGKSLGSSDAVSDSFDLSDPYAYVPADVKEAAGNEFLPTGIDDSDENTSFKEHWISPEIDPGDFICAVEKNAETSQTKRVPGRTSSKRSRAADVHNMSEKRRRSRINEKMKALQNLIPNSNKTDKASMLDEAIEYLKQLQFQVQMLMMRNGLSLHPLCLPGGLQPMTPPQTGLSFDESNRNQNSCRGIASVSLNAAECLVHPSGLSLPKHCNISDQPVIMPSMTNMANPDASSSGFRFHVGQFDPSPSSKDAISDGAPQLHLDATKVEKNASSDVS